MWAFLSKYAYFLIALGVLTACGLSYAFGYDRGIDKGIARIEEYHETQAATIVKVMRDEHTRQMKHIEKMEPVIQERIVEREKIVTEYEQVVAAAPDSCVESFDRVHKYNTLIRQGNAQLPSNGNE